MLKAYKDLSEGDGRLGTSMGKGRGSGRGSGRGKGSEDLQYDPDLPPNLSVQVLYVLQFVVIVLFIFHMVFYFIATVGHSSIPANGVDYTNSVTSTNDDYGKISDREERLAFSQFATFFSLLPVTLITAGAFFKLPLVLDIANYSLIIILLSLAYGAEQVMDITYKCRVKNGPATSNNRNNCNTGYDTFMAGTVFLLFINIGLLFLSVAIKGHIRRWFPAKNGTIWTDLVRF